MAQHHLPKGHAHRREFTNLITEQQKLNANFVNSVIFPGEAHDHFDSFVNRHKCQIRGLENPQIILEKKINSKPVTVWYIYCSLVKWLNFFLTRQVKYYKQMANVIVT